MNMGNKKLTYEEVAETMSGLAVDVYVIAKKAKQVLGRINQLPKVESVKDEAIGSVIMETTPAFFEALEVITKVCELYARSKYVTGRKGS